MDIESVIPAWLGEDRDLSVRGGGYLLRSRITGLGGEPEPSPMSRKKRRRAEVVIHRVKKSAIVVVARFVGSVERRRKPGV